MKRPKSRKHELKSVPHGLLDYILQQNKRWVRDCWGVYNTFPYDSRSLEWHDVLHRFMTSSVSRSEVSIRIKYDEPQNPRVVVHNSAYDVPHHRERCVQGIIKDSNLCSRVLFHHPRYSILLMGPLDKAVPFCVDLIASPPDHTNEARFVKDNYIFTVVIGLKMFEMSVEVFRR
jgi:hypothetical protein